MHFSAAELADMKLPGLPASEQNMRTRAEREGWAFVEVAARGKNGTRREYQATSLPNEARQALISKLLHNDVSSSAGAHSLTPAVALAPGLSRSDAGFSGGGVPSLSPSAGLSIPAPGALKDWQREVATARNSLLAEVRRIGASVGTESAIQTLVRLASEGGLPEHLQRLVPIANSKAGKDGKRTLSRRSLYRWLGDAKAGFAALAPRDAEKLIIPAWAPALMKLRARPQGVSLAWCLEKWAEEAPAGIAPPSYSAARRFIDKLGNVERERGRRLPRELKALRPFVRRSTDHMNPGDCYTADGHTLDSETAHPAHGKAFRPEMTPVLDVATRKCVGWSAGLAESTWAVMDAMRYAVETCGIPALFYVDNGSGYKNACQSQEVIGFADRVGYEITHSLPYNSQARGIIERAHQTIWVRAAKELPTYMGAAMDREARQKVFKLTRAHIKAAGASPLLMPWADFLRWCQEKVDAYNARPHRSLPKIRDAATGKLRHMSPNDAWDAAIAGGWSPVLPTTVERDDLFRPYQLAKVIRGEVRLFNNLYFSGALEEHHGDQVQVGYDIHDASRVWVRDLEGRLICTAEFEANKRAYFPQSVIDRAAEKRAQARERRLEVHLQEVRDELAAPALLEHQPTISVPFGGLAALDRAERRQQEKSDIAAVKNDLEAAGVTVMPGIEVRPLFRTDPDRYRWLVRHPQLWDAQDAEWLLSYVHGDEYADLLIRFEHDGLAWTDQDKGRAWDLIEDFEAAAGV
jgi:putative transposase